MQEFDLLNYRNVLDKVLFLLLVTSRELFLANRERPAAGTAAILKSLAAIAMQTCTRIDYLAGERVSGRPPRTHTDLAW